MNKLVIALSVLVASSASWAAAVTPCSQGTATTVTAASPNAYIKANFTPKCSANTIVSWEEGNTSAAVAGVSVKGNEVFSGHTAGGAVTKAGSCAAASGCASSDLTTPLSTALTASSS